MNRAIENGSNLPTVFSYSESNELRTISNNDQPWFAAVDICMILGLQNPSYIIKRVDEDERAIFKIGRQGTTWFVNESGLYNLIFRSDKPQARKFRKWVTNEVLPTIRLTGSYSLKWDPETSGLKIMEVRGAKFYDYIALLKHCGLSLRSGSRSGRRRRNPQEFLFIEQTWLVNCRHGDYIATMSKMRKEQKVFRILRNRFIEDRKARQLELFGKGGRA